MKTRGTRALLALIVVAALVWLWTRNSERDLRAPPPRSPSAPLSTPIEFYGKVVDERGRAVPGATAIVWFADTAGEGHSKRSVLSDGAGMFCVGGHGLGIVVLVSKVGYYSGAKSTGKFAYASGIGSVERHPDPKAPAVFVLRKRGQPVSLIEYTRYFRVPRNGEPVDVDLITGKQAARGEGDFRVQTWTHDEHHQLNSTEPYDWRCRVTIPGGGLTDRRDPESYEAPEAGYRPADEIDMPASLGRKWQARQTRKYFAHLADGRFARIEFQMVAEDDHFFSVKCDLNPRPNDRNLESDPQHIIEPSVQ